MASGVARGRCAGQVSPQLLAGLGVAFVLAALLVLGVRGGGPAVLAPAGGEVRHVAATARGLWWIEASGGSSRLMFLDRVGGQPRVVTTGANLTACAVRDSDTYFLDAGVDSAAPAGRLLRVPADASASPVPLAESLTNPTHLLVDDQGICWTETLPARAPAVPHVPALGCVSLLRSLPRQGGTPRLVARIADTTPAFSGQLLGSSGEECFWMESRAGGELGVTLLRSAPRQGGDPATRWLSCARSRGALSDLGSAFVSDTSTEASPAGAFASVHSLPLSGGASNAAGGESNAAGEPTLLTDWLLPGGWLLARERSVYYVGESLWQVPEARDWPREFLPKIGSPAAADIGRGFCSAAVRRARLAPAGAAAPAGGNSMEPVVLARWPLTLRARVRAALHAW